MLPLPKGTQSFSTLRLRNELYVDKTAMIYELTRFSGTYFIARPRRFGKSLLLSTVESLFKKGLEEFQGLAIEHLWQDKTYSVISIDFALVSEFKDPDDFLNKLCKYLSVVFQRFGFTSSGDPTLFLFELNAWLKQQPDNSLVLLVDEYDAPLTRVLHQKVFFDGVQSILRAFYSVMKNAGAAFRFILITGITRFNHTGIFSGFNNLQDITLNPFFSTLLGYTEEELKSYFGAYLARAAEWHRMTEDQLLDQLREYYDGFCFDDQASKHVYCPWSILNFFTATTGFRFDNYWFLSGGQPTVLMNYLAHRKLEQPLDFFETVTITPSQLLASNPYEHLDVNVLLQQTGYLTIKHVDVSGGLELGYPNKEVSASMAMLYSKVMVGNDIFTSQPLLKFMLNGDVEPAMAFVNQVFRSLNYQRYPVRDEASFQGALQILMIGISLLPQVEVHSAQGRSDLEVVAGDFLWVFELKWSKNGQAVPHLLQAAQDQIETRHYGETTHGKALRRVAMVFDESKRQVHWKALP